jgi:hypothetical protein
MGLHPVEIALQRVDLAVMGDDAKWLGQMPGGEGVGGIALVIDGEAGDETLVAGRTVKQVLGTFEELANKGAAVRVITQPGMDTTTVMGRLIVTIMAAVAEMERDLIRERTIAGLRSARERGRMGGRTSKLTDEEVLRLAPLGTAKAMARAGLKSKPGWRRRVQVARGREKSRMEAIRENGSEEAAHIEQLAGYEDAVSGSPPREGMGPEYARGYAAGTSAKEAE